MMGENHKHTMRDDGESMGRKVVVVVVVVMVVVVKAELVTAAAAVVVVVVVVVVVFPIPPPLSIPPLTLFLVFSSKKGATIFHKILNTQSALTIYLP